MGVYVFAKRLWGRPFRTRANWIGCVQALTQLVFLRHLSLVDWIIAMIKAYGVAYGNRANIDIDANGKYIR